MGQAAELREGRRRLAEAASVTVLTGAGISAESGVPTFRGTGGLWKTYRPEDLATPEAFARDPVIVWEWYQWRRQKVAACRPNPGHEALAGLEPSKESFSLVTQNVDGLHRLAGSRNIIELHGNLWRLRCVSCRFVAESRQTIFPELPPHCECGSFLRPDVVWFGEPLPLDGLARAARAAESADVVLVVGTSAIVYPAASIPVLGKQAGAFVIEVNVERTPMSGLADATLLGEASRVLPELCGNVGSQ